MRPQQPVDAAGSIRSVPTILMSALFLLFSGFTQPAFAQNCPAGIPSAGNPLCIPPDRENSPYYQGQNSYSKPQVIWADRWGAIAIDDSNGSVGVSSDESSEKNAELAALIDCMPKGNRKCAVRITYKNKCAALIEGRNSYVSISGDTVDEASRIGKEKCALEDVDCQIYYTGCSLPRRIR